MDFAADPEMEALRINTRALLRERLVSEAYTRAAEACQCIVGPEALLGGWVDHAVLDAPVTTNYGGTSEIQRNLIAERHLGLPRAR